MQTSDTWRKIVVILTMFFLVVPTSFTFADSEVDGGQNSGGGKDSSSKSSDSGKSSQSGGSTDNGTGAGPGGDGSGNGYGGGNDPGSGGGNTGSGSGPGGNTSGGGSTGGSTSGGSGKASQSGGGGLGDGTDNSSGRGGRSNQTGGGGGDGQTSQSGYTGPSSEEVAEAVKQESASLIGKASAAISRTISNTYSAALSTVSKTWSSVQDWFEPVTTGGGTKEDGQRFADLGGLGDNAQRTDPDNSSPRSGQPRAPDPTPGVPNYSESADGTTINFTEDPKVEKPTVNVAVYDAEGKKIAESTSGSDIEISEADALGATVEISYNVPGADSVLPTLDGIRSWEVAGKKAAEVTAQLGPNGGTYEVTAKTGQAQVSEVVQVKISGKQLPDPPSEVIEAQNTYTTVAYTGLALGPEAPSLEEAAQELDIELGPPPVDLDPVRLDNLPPKEAQPEEYALALEEKIAAAEEIVADLQANLWDAQAKARASEVLDMSTLQQLADAQGFFDDAQSALADLQSLDPATDGVQIEDGLEDFSENAEYADEVTQRNTERLDQQLVAEAWSRAMDERDAVKAPGPDIIDSNKTRPGTVDPETFAQAGADVGIAIDYANVPGIRPSLPVFDLPQISPEDLSGAERKALAEATGESVPAEDPSFVGRMVNAVTGYFGGLTGQIDVSPERVAEIAVGLANNDLARLREEVDDATPTTEQAQALSRAETALTDANIALNTIQTSPDLSPADRTTLSQQVVAMATDVQQQLDATFKTTAQSLNEYGTGAEGQPPQELDSETDSATPGQPTLSFGDYVTEINPPVQEVVDAKLRAAFSETELTFGPEIAQLATERTNTTIGAIATAEKQLEEFEVRTSAGNCENDSACAEVKNRIKKNLTSAKSRLAQSAFGNDPLSSYEAYAMSKYANEVKQLAEEVVGGELSGESGSVTDLQISSKNVFALGDRYLSGPGDPRGLRGFGPGNIMDSGDAWIGMTGTDGRFVTFSAPELGIRAIVRTQRSYQEDGLLSISQRISKWAPPNENNTQAYINRVASHLGVDPNEPIDINDDETAAKLAEAIIEVENGRNPYSLEQIGLGVKMERDQTLAISFEKAVKENPQANNLNFSTKNIGVGTSIERPTVAGTSLSFGETKAISTPELTVDKAREINAERAAKYAADELNFTSSLSRADGPEMAAAEKLDEEREVVEIVRRTADFNGSALGTANASLQAAEVAFTSALSRNDGPTLAQAEALDSARESITAAEKAAAEAEIAAAKNEIVETVAKRAEVRIESYVATGLSNAVEDGPESSRNRKTELEVAQDYLWEAYQKSTASWKGKDVRAAEHNGMTVKEYVIGGMNREFAKRMAAAGMAMEADGIDFVINSAFRDDYRQDLATGKKARTGLSHHGGSISTDGYGDGKAVDIQGAAAQAWIDRRGREFGVTRPYDSPGSLTPGFTDAPHVGPVENGEATRRGLGLKPGESLDEFGSNASAVLEKAPNEGIPTAAALRAEVTLSLDEKVTLAATNIPSGSPQKEPATEIAREVVSLMNKARSLEVDPADSEGVADLISPESEAEISRLADEAEDRAIQVERLQIAANQRNYDSPPAISAPRKGLFGRIMDNVKSIFNPDGSVSGRRTATERFGVDNSNRQYTPRADSPAEVAAPIADPTKIDIEKRGQAIEELIGGQTSTPVNTDPLTGQPVTKNQIADVTETNEVRASAAVPDAVAEAAVVSPVVVEIDDKKGVAKRPDLERALEERNPHRFTDPLAQSYLSPNPSTVLDDTQDKENNHIPHVNYSDGLFTEATTDDIDRNHTYIYELPDDTRVIAPHTNNTDTSGPSAYIDLASTLIETGGEGVVRDEELAVEESFVSNLFSEDTPESFTIFEVTDVKYARVPGPDDRRYTGTLEYSITLDDRLVANAALLGLTGSKTVEVNLPEVTTLENAERIFGAAGFDGNIHILLNLAEFVGEERSLSDRLWAGLRGVSEWFDFGDDYDTDSIISLSVYPNAVVSCPDIDGIENGYAYEVFVESPTDRDMVEVIRDTRCGSFDMTEIVEDIAGHLERKYGFVAVETATILDRTTENTALIPYDPTIDAAQIIQPLLEEMR